MKMAYRNRTDSVVLTLMQRAAFLISLTEAGKDGRQKEKRMTEEEMAG